MKLNNIVENDNIKREEISNIYKILKIKYNFEFDDKKIYSLARELYDNGIRSYMFFDEKLGVDEIVYYLLRRNKIKRFPVKRVYSFDYRDDVFESDSNKDNIIKINSFVRRRIRK